MTLTLDKACPAARPDPGSKPWLLAHALDSGDDAGLKSRTGAQTEREGESDAKGDDALPEDRFHLRLPQGKHRSPKFYTHLTVLALEKMVDSLAPQAPHEFFAAPTRLAISLNSRSGRRLKTGCQHSPSSTMSMLFSYCRR